MKSYLCRWAEGLKGDKEDARSTWPRVSRLVEMPMKAVSASMSSLSVSTADERLNGRRASAKLNGKKRESELIMNEPGHEGNRGLELRKRKVRRV